MKRSVAMALVVAVVFAAAAVLVTALSTTPALAGGCNCPAIWDPVICNDGQTYSNACYARCAHARGCVSAGGGPIQ